MDYDYFDFEPRPEAWETLEKRPPARDFRFNAHSPEVLEWHYGFAFSALNVRTYVDEAREWALIDSPHSLEPYCYEYEVFACKVYD